MEEKDIKIEGVTPATLAIAVIFFICIIYFIGEIYWWGSEYYAETPPYFFIGLITIALTAISFYFLRTVEPERPDTKNYAILACLGFALCSYAIIPRINIMTDSDGLADYEYFLDDNYIWQSTQGYPPLNVYLSITEYWQQFEPGDRYIFQLRKGGLNIWLINMDKIYEDQKKFYDCKGFASCTFKNPYNFDDDKHE